LAVTLISHIEVTGTADVYFEPIRLEVGRLDISAAADLDIVKMFDSQIVPYSPPGMQTDSPGGLDNQVSATHISLEILDQIVLSLDFELLFVAHLNIQRADSRQLDAGDILDLAFLSD
jgi:hypothetical protein